MPENKNQDRLNFLDEAIQTSKQAFKFVFLFSFAANILMLALPIYTLQVLDRVVSTGSMQTLFMLTVVIGGLLIAYGAFMAVRSATLIRLGQWFDKQVGSKLVALSLSISAIAPGVSASQYLRDLTNIKTFIMGPSLTALFDAPWSIIYFAVIFMIHPMLGVVSIVGGIALMFFAILNERAAKKATNKANEISVKTMGAIETSSRNSEVIEAMGMMDYVVNKWREKNDEMLDLQAVAGGRSNLVTSAAKAVRSLLQVMIMGVGAYLVINNSLTVGGMIACSILAGRALAPFEIAISGWNQVTSARQSYERLKKVIDNSPQRVESISLPAPEGSLLVEKLVFAFPGTEKAIIRGVEFALNPGDILGIIGPSASGKTTLAKLMVGVWKPSNGAVRLDSADVYSWNRADFGQHIGYLPQDVELFEGTIRENIARMKADASDEDVVAAGKISGAHEMILRLPEGYDTHIGAGGANLSAGQRQRVGLARAFFGNPKFLVLDEPNSNLDDIGENALVMAIKNAKELKITTVIIAHRPTVLNFVDKILLLRDGLAADFGPAKEILAKYARGATPQVQQQQAQQQVQQQAQQKQAQQQAVQPQPQVVAQMQARQTAKEEVIKEEKEPENTKAKPKKKPTKKKAASTAGDN